MLEYKPVRVPTKSTMLRYFWKDLKPFVLAKLEYQDLKLESFNQMVKKTIDAKAKSALQSRSSTKEIDQNCPRGNQQANSTIAKCQSNTMKDLWVKEFKVRDPELSGPQGFESSKKARKEKKKGQRQRD